MSEKKTFLNSGAGIFGVHLQGKCVRFYDADFCNLLEMTQYVQEEPNLPDLLKYINTFFKKREFKGPLLELPKYLNPEGVVSELENSKQIFLRFNSFENALEAYRLMNTYPMSYVNTFIKSINNEIYSL